MSRFFHFIFLFYISVSSAQDSIYTRNTIRYLSSEICFGRGYVKNGLQQAETFLITEIKKTKAKALFTTGFTQSFYHSVNTYPSAFDVTLNGKKLIPGSDFIVNPNSQGIKGKFRLTMKDSSSFEFRSPKKSILVSLRKKLTYSVATKVNSVCEIEIDKTKFTEMPSEITLNITNKFIPKFESRNIGCMLEGNSNSDSTIVFTAHYDHLGGMGKHTFFPGANDNASGVSFLLNLLKHYSLNPPKYRMVFIWFAGEEAGLLGSEYFVKNPAIQLNKIKFLINLDLLGTGEDGLMVVNGAIFASEFNRLQTLNNNQQLVSTIKKRGKAANSDHYWFSESNVPCFFVYTLGGIAAYHDIFDIEKTLPLTKYNSIFKLIINFVSGF